MYNYLKMKNITNVLSEEHEIILKVIDAALEECYDIEGGKELDVDLFKKTIDFIINYADKFHHAKEEDILFKAMLSEEGNLHCNPIPVMLNEHEEGRRYLKGMVKALNTNDVPALLSNTKGYSFLLQNHIYKEDNILYPMAESALSDEDKDSINAKYAVVEAQLKEEMDIDKLIFV